MPYCGICDLGFISDEALDAHRSDKKHLSRSEEYQRRVFEAAHCVHVTGFSRNISHENLAVYFANFGKVLDLTYIDNNNSRWPFAFVKFENLQVASQVLRYKHHCLNGHFLRVQQKRLKFRNPGRLEVSNADGSNQVGCQQQGGYQGKSSKKLKDVKFMAQEDFNEMFSILIEKLGEKETIDEQMIHLFEELQLTDDDLTHRAEFCELLYSIMEPYFPGCSVVLFGSSVNGFGVKGCDIDIFLDIGHLIPEESPPPPSATESPNSALKQMIQKDAMPVQMKEFLQLTTYQRIKYLLKILARNLHTNYCNFFPVPSTRCPIIRFSHKSSEITCDFSIQNKMGLCNSQLMKFLSKYDSRIRPFVFAIRLWAKSKKLASVGGTRFSSYSLTLMIIFFLQNVEPAVLPPIQELMDSCTKEEEIVINGINCSFPQRSAHTVLPPNNNKDRLGDLLEKFFAFFLNLDYEDTVISPRTGNLLSASEIKSQEELKSFRISPVCVQDPYLLEHNTSGNVTEKIKTDLIRELTVAQYKLSQEKTDGNPWGLALLLITEEPPAEPAKTPKTKSKPQNLPNSLSLPINFGSLDKEMDKSVRKFQNTRLLWCKILCSFLQIVLEDLLLIECCVEKENLSLKELLKTTQEDGSGDCKTNTSLSSDVVIKNEAMKDEAMDAICNANNNENTSDSLKKPAQVFQKRQSDESIRGEVKRICFKDQEILEKNSTDDSNWKEYTDEVSESCENMDTKLSDSSCKQCSSDKNTPSLNDSEKEAVEAMETSESNSLQEKTNVDDVAPSEAEKEICADEEPDPNSLLQMICTVRHYTWRNRKKVRQKLVSQWGGSDFEMERKISEHIISVNQSVTPKPSLATFRFTVMPEVDSTVRVHINPVMSACKEVSVFYQFLSSFITRMTSSHFVKWCISNSARRLDLSETEVKMSTNKPSEKSEDGLLTSTN